MKVFSIAYVVINLCCKNDVMIYSLFFMPFPFAGTLKSRTNICKLLEKSKVMLFERDKTMAINLNYFGFYVLSRCSR